LATIRKHGDGLRIQTLHAPFNRSTVVRIESHPVAPCESRHQSGGARLRDQFDALDDETVEKPQILFRHSIDGLDCGNTIDYLDAVLVRDALAS
jgi:hypothetical protein